jgi:DNA (cytosine-5)-methyltransferase 1
MMLGSLFDGIGGFPLAAARHGIKTLWTSDIDPACEAVTKARFPDAVQLGDITKIDGRKIEPVDIISGGSPCQDLSVAGKRAGLEGARSGLFMEMIRIIREMRSATGKFPRYVIWENVPGAYSSNGGEDFRAVVEEFCRCADRSADVPRPARWGNAGCVMGNEYSFAWRTLDAQFWGVPQRRRRIYLIADF